jgi:coenzyme Q-binding protein COQ10
VSDIDSYHKFLPYCETFKSKVVCSPEASGGVVEASGSENGIFDSLNVRWEIVQCGKDGEEEVVVGVRGDGAGDVGSDMKLHLEFRFKNPLYAAVSAALAPKIAKVMIEAFEKRAKEILEPVRESEGERL